MRRLQGHYGGTTRLLLLLRGSSCALFSKILSVHSGLRAADFELLFALSGPLNVAINYH